MPVPFVDLRAQMREISDEIRPELEAVYRDAAFIGGPRVAAFEREFAEYIGVEHVIGVGNGTDALELMLLALGVERGAEVILPANTFIATAEAVSRIGAVPVLVDVDPELLLIDPAAVEAAITPRTQAILPVHLFGRVAPMAALSALASRHGLLLVEDAAQAQGARQGRHAAGAVGVAAATSFYPGKNLGAAGDAGAVLTSDEHVARSVRRLGSHGGLGKYEHDRVGSNSRLDVVQAVVLRAKLRRLDAWNVARARAASYYEDRLGSVPGISTPRLRADSADVWHLYVVEVEDRDAVQRQLESAQIGCGVHYPTPIHLTGAYRHLGLRQGAFPVAEAAAHRILSLPMHPHLSQRDQDEVSDVLIASVMGRVEEGAA
jgi:dTDP-4-amino-4,6-dideoxygalactose transaminase